MLDEANPTSDASEAEDEPAGLSRGYVPQIQAPGLRRYFYCRAFP